MGMMINTVKTLNATFRRMLRSTGLAATRPFVGLVKITSFCLIVAVGAGCLDSLVEDPSSPKPNVVVILVDALRSDYLGVNGYSEDSTPAIDEIARSGANFKFAYSQAPKTLPSTASLLTSRNVPLFVKNTGFQEIPGLSAKKQRHFEENVPRLSKRNIVVSEVFSDAGYRTIGVFTNPHHHPTSGFGQGFDESVFLGPIGGSAYRRASEVNDNLMKLLEHSVDSRPFFAYLHFMDTHHPYDPPKGFLRQSVDRDTKYKYMSGIPQGEAEPTDAELHYLKALYEGEVRFVDSEIDRIWKYLGKCGPTVLVIASDHGDEFMEHRGLGHGRTLEPEILHVPLVIAGAGVPQGATVNSLVRNIDISPTILELAGIPIPAEFEGRSLLRLLTKGVDDEGGEGPRVSVAAKGGMRSITTDDWHLIWFTSEKSKVLYSMKTDSRGETDVSANHPDVVADLWSILEDYDEALNTAKKLASSLNEERENGEAREMPLSPEIAEQLEALGYVEN
jgi:arylsulfatase A-like enzyme